MQSYRRAQPEDSMHAFAVLLIICQPVDRSTSIIPSLLHLTRLPTPRAPGSRLSSPSSYQLSQGQAFTRHVHVSGRVIVAQYVHF